eukprot:7082854-Alexandrium_andersonii.AAC.1
MCIRDRSVSVCLCVLVRARICSWVPTCARACPCARVCAQLRARGRLMLRRVGYEGHRLTAPGPVTWPVKQKQQSACLSASRCAGSR